MKGGTFYICILPMEGPHNIFTILVDLALLPITWIEEADSLELGTAGSEMIRGMGDS